MTDPVSRTTFYEGEILPAGDLNAAGDYPRNQLARHDRYLHSWGIASGLDLSGVPNASAGGTAYKVVTVKAGVAIDGTGREIVAPDDFTLTPSDFQGEVTPLPDPKVWYPFFLVGLDQPGSTSSNLTGACNNSQPTRVQETYNIVYGNPGDELNLDQQQSVANVSDGPGDGVTTTPWRVLLGFVQWSADLTTPQFTDVTDLNPTSGIGRRYVGVNASEVISESGTLILATHPANFSGQNPIMAVEIQEANAGSLVFGKLNPDGSVNAVLTVNAKGDITAQGQIRGALAGGGVQVESGLATHGMTLPLPSGVTEDQVTSGDALVQTLVSIHLNGTENPDPTVVAGIWGAFPLECFVDDQRRVHCRVRWFEISPGLGVNVEDRPAVCEYMIAVATKPGSSS